MSELYEEENKILITEIDETEKVPDVQSSRPRPAVDARRKLESLLEEKRLRDELNDFIDY